MYKETLNKNEIENIVKESGAGNYVGHAFVQTPHDPALNYLLVLTRENKRDQISGYLLDDYQLVSYARDITASENLATISELSDTFPLPSKYESEIDAMVREMDILALEDNATGFLAYYYKGMTEKLGRNYAEDALLYRKDVDYVIRDYLARKASKTNSSLLITLTEKKKEINDNLISLLKNLVQNSSKESNPDERQ